MSQVVPAIPGTFFCAWYAAQKHWLANNILGLAFCIQGIEMLSLGSFNTGAILLAGLFVYDIFWVFFTPVMVSVAKSFDAPIKLLFPSGMLARPFSMLGLGDIVSPGIFVALELRYDVSKGKDNHYFKSAFLGYTIGLVATIVVMNWFQAAQPALLYIVPGVIGFLATHCLWNGDVKPFVRSLSGWTATLLFMWMPVAQMWTNFLNPDNIRGLSAISMLLAMTGNGLLIPRALFVKDLMLYISLPSSFVFL